MAKRGRSKKSSNWLTVIMLAVVLIAAVAAGIYYASSRAEKDVEGGITGAPEQIELLEESKAAQKAVDDILLTRDNWQLTDNGRAEPTTGSLPITAAPSRAKNSLPVRK